MRTDDLINVIVADNATVTRPIRQMIFAAFGIGCLLAVIAFTLLLGIRPDFAHAITHDPRFMFKFVFAIGLAIPAATLVNRLSRPDGAGGIALTMVAIPLLLLGAAVLLEMFLVPPERWSAAALGTMPGTCLTYIPLLSIAPFIATLAALRYGAPARPAVAGAAAGLASASIAAALYAAFCVDDSPMFVAIWYVAGIAAVTLLGSLIGGRLLRW